MKLSDLNFSNQILSLLKKDSINTLEDLLHKTEKELLQIKGFGKSSLNKLKEVLKQNNLKLGMDLHNSQLIDLSSELIHSKTEETIEIGRHEILIDHDEIEKLREKM